MSEMCRKYSAFYDARNPTHVYPVEFVVRAFLGNYPRLKNEPAIHQGRRVLDLGFGDGRNMPLLHSLGMTISGVEISEEICALTRARMSRMSIDVDLRVGCNRSIPFDDGEFDAVLACHACYYVDIGTTFAENIAEIWRVLKPGGNFVFSVPMASSYILVGAQDLGGGHMRIVNDPYGVRNDSVLKKFDTEDEIRSTLAPAFEDFAIGSCRNDFWGIEEHVWIVVCRKGRRKSEDR
jgi:SAM-dependent methyltransferase